MASHGLYAALPFQDANHQTRLFDLHSGPYGTKLSGTLRLAKTTRSAHEML